MAPQKATILSFFGREISVPGDQTSLNREAGERLAPGDGFTSIELAAAMNPLHAKFRPTRQYPEIVIAALEAGPNTVMFTGRIVNFSVYLGNSKSHLSAKGWHHVVVKDDTGAICVKLYFARQPYPLKLGLLVSIYTPFISEATSTKSSFAIAGAPLATSIFPGREASVHIVFHETSSSLSLRCRTPLSYTPGVELEGLLTLKTFVNGGNEIADSRILVCVKSIGAIKRIHTKKGGELDLLDVTVFDDTADAVLSLWGAVTMSTKDWRPSKTVLLISRPGFRFGFKEKGSLGLTPWTMVDVDPEFADAEWLRKYAVKAHKAESIKQEWLEGVFDVKGATEGLYRILFTIADVDEWARTNKDQIFTGFLSLIIMDLGLALNKRRNMLLCSECCGISIYANTLSTECKNCSSSVPLALNPRIIGTLLDETGSIEPGKLLWSPHAWEELFGRTLAQLVDCDIVDTRILEQKLMGLRVHLCFGWAAKVGKLAVLGVRM